MRRAREMVESQLIDMLGGGARGEEAVEWRERCG
jgi:hypothetical protein